MRKTLWFSLRDRGIFLSLLKRLYYARVVNLFILNKNNIIKTVKNKDGIDIRIIEKDENSQRQINEIKLLSNLLDKFDKKSVFEMKADEFNLRNELKYGTTKWTAAMVKQVYIAQKSNKQTHLYRDCNKKEYLNKIRSRQPPILLT